MIDIHHTPTPEKAVAQAVSEYLRARADVPTLLMIAGGSLPDAVLPHIDRGVLSPQLTISIFDERCTEDESGLNELQLQATPFYKDALRAGVNAMNVVVGDETTCPLVAVDWEKRLRQWQAENLEGEIVVLAGVGADGHIAGIFSHTQAEHETFASEAWIVSHHFSDTDDRYPTRITPTFTFWRDAVAMSFIYTKGEEKAEVLQSLFSTTPDLTTTPAQVLSKLPLESLRLYSDREPR